MKLTKDLKDKILDAILEHRFGKERKALKAERHAHAVSVYNEKYSVAERKLMATLPKGWMFEAESVYVSLGGNFTQIEFPVPLRLSQGSRRGQALVSLGPDHPLSLRYGEIGTTGEALEAAISAATLDVCSILNSVTTTERLRDRWPEAIKIIDRILDAEPKPASLPAIPMADVNARLALPPKGRK